jgi:hypothetical protein
MKEKIEYSISIIDYNCGKLSVLRDIHKDGQLETQLKEIMMGLNIAKKELRNLCNSEQQLEIKISDYLKK